MFTSHIHDLTFMSGGGGEGGAVTDKKATTDKGPQCCNVSVNPLDISKETMRQSPAVFLTRPQDILQPYLQQGKPDNID